MANAVDFETMDRRLAERLLKKGLVSEKEFDKFLKTLSDVGAKADTVQTQFEVGAGTGKTR